MMSSPDTNVPGTPPKWLSRLKTIRARLFYELIFHTRLRPWFFHRYSYMHAPRQLAFLLDCIDKTRNIPGSIVEVGCAGGSTTVWLKRHMKHSAIGKEYIAIDTFSGFTERDISDELSRQNRLGRETSWFRVNKKKWVAKALEYNGASDVRLVEADINDCELGSFARHVSFCLIDVDLFRPVAAALEKVWPLLSKGGMIVVDDCETSMHFRGAYDAYVEFVTRHNLPVTIVHGKFGILSRE